MLLRQVRTVSARQLVAKALDRRIPLLFSSSRHSVQCQASSDPAAVDVALSDSLASAAGLLEAGVAPTGIEAFAEVASHARPPANLRVSLTDIPGSRVDQLTEVLLSLGAQSSSLSEHRAGDAPEQEIYEGGSSPHVWDRCDLAALFAPDADVQAAMQRVQQVLELQELDYSVEEVQDQEWEDAIKASYVPIKVCEGLWVVPEWCSPEEPEALNVRLTPGLAFGTGEHPTTQLCLRWLKAQHLQNCRLVDYGCGSGVLGIAALLMGADFVAGLDIDPFAVSAAEANAALNGVERKLKVIPCDPVLQGRDPLEELSTPTSFWVADICIANILRGPLEQLAPRLTNYVSPHGRIVMSGILTSQVDLLKEVYGEAFDDWEVHTEDRWALLTGRRIPPQL